MSQILKINKESKVPIYQQIIDSVMGQINSGSLTVGSKIPSINEIADTHNLARETVVKAFKELRANGFITSVQGKGFYISSTNSDSVINVFLFFDTLSAYKEVMFNSIREHFGKKAKVDIYFHHFNIKVFERTIVENNGNYNYYIILPFESMKIGKILSILPPDKVYMLDRYPALYKGSYTGVYQDFENDIYNALQAAWKKNNHYKKIVMYFRNTITILPKELITGLERFCIEKKIACEVVHKPFTDDIRKGEAYIVIDDEDLVKMILIANQKKYVLGKEVGILSYNETSLKKVVGNGISVISTDFALMGERIADMVLKRSSDCIKNPCYFIDRGSF